MISRIVINTYMRLQELLTEVTKVKLIKSQEETGAWVSSDNKPEQIINIPISKIDLFEPEDKTSKNNASKESRKAVESIKTAIRQHRKIPPILVRRQHLRFQVVDGHHRLQAYKELKLPTIPANILQGYNIKNVVEGKLKNQQIDQEFDSIHSRFPVNFTVMINGKMWKRNGEPILFKDHTTAINAANKITAARNVTTQVVQTKRKGP